MGMQKNNRPWTPQRVLAFQDQELNYPGGKVRAMLNSCDGGWDLVIIAKDGMTRRLKNVDILTVCSWLNDLHPEIF